MIEGRSIILKLSRVCTGHILVSDEFLQPLVDQKLEREGCYVSFQICNRVILLIPQLAETGFV
jgi:hypothetical protein